MYTDNDYLLLHVHTHEFAVNFQPNGIQTTGNELQELRCWLYDFMTGCVCNQCMLYHAALSNFTITKVLHLVTPHHLTLCSINNIPQRLASACNELQELRCWLYDFMTGCVCNQCMLYHAALSNFTITKVLHLVTPHHLTLCSINNIPQRLASACNELQELRCWLYDFMTGCVVGIDDAFLSTLV
ncbi:hypothetical protein QEN19_001656 [Hanseniaspora menglaensis]